MKKTMTDQMNTAKQILDEWVKEEDGRSYIVFAGTRDGSYVTQNASGSSIWAILANILIERKDLKVIMKMAIETAENYVREEEEK